jgi:hypothetical protein
VENNQRAYVLGIFKKLGFKTSDISFLDPIQLKEYPNKSFYPLEIKVDDVHYYFYLNYNKEIGELMVNFCHYQGALVDITKFPNLTFNNPIKYKYFRRGVFRREAIESFFHVLKKKNYSIINQQKINLEKLTSYFNNEGFGLNEDKNKIITDLFYGDGQKCRIVIANQLLGYKITLADNIRIKYKSKFPIEEILYQLKMIGVVPKSKEKESYSDIHPLISINKKIKDYIKSLPVESKLDIVSYRSYIEELKEYLKEGELLLKEISQVEFADDIHSLLNKNKKLLKEFINNQKHHYKRKLDKFVKISSEETALLISEANKLIA